MRELADYLAAHYGKAGRTSLNVEILPISAVKAANSARETVKFTVSSPRLDTIVSAVFRVSRRDAVSAIAQGRVFVNEAEAFKPDYNLKEGEKVVLRGKGKAIYLGVSGTSKKGKLYVTMEKFV
jgi:RNA-binding protein YlmH